MSLPNGDSESKAVALASPVRRQDDLFFAAVTTTRTPILVADARHPDQPIIYANDAFRKMTGYSDPEIYGRNCRFLQGPDTDRTVFSSLRTLLSEGKEFSAEVLNYRKDKTTFWNELFIAPIFNEDNELVYYFASQSDVSRRHEAEEGLLQARKMEAMGQLAGGVAHDFNNLLQVMVGYVDLLEKSVKSSGPYSDKVSFSIGKIRGAVKVASSLTQQLLVFARRQVLLKRTVNLNEICSEMLGLARQTLGDEVEIHTQLAENLRNCHLDVGQLEMAVLNILLNARDALANRSDAQVLLRTDDFDVEHVRPDDSLPPGKYVALSIADNGPGMTPEVIAQALKPFFTTKAEGKGTGLGLSRATAFAEQLGGTLTIASTDGLGTTLTFYFPAVEEHETANEDAKNAMTPTGNERVLIVDDRRDVGDVAQAMLGELGYATRLALNATDALTILRSGEAFDVLFTDHAMPGGMSGVGLAREARRISPGLRVLLATGYAEPDDDLTGSNGVSFKIIHKPYRQADLAREIRQVLDNARWQ